MAELRIAPLTRDDLGEVAEVHLRAFTDSAISALGHEAVRRYYQWLLEGPHDAKLVGAWLGDRLVGFCAAGRFRGAMNGFLRANRRYLAWRIASHPRLWTSTLVRDRIKRALSITLRFSRLSRPPQTAPSANFGVLAIATDPAVRGLGAGRALMLEAEQRARGLGHAQMTLTVHVDNAHAIAFYEQLGWLRRASFAETGEMERDLH